MELIIDVFMDNVGYSFINMRNVGYYFNFVIKKKERSVIISDGRVHGKYESHYGIFILSSYICRN